MIPEDHPTTVASLMAEEALCRRAALAAMLAEQLSAWRSMFRAQATQFGNREGDEV